MNSPYIDARHELTTASQVVDVRPLSTRLGEILSNKWYMSAAALPCIALAPMFPIVAPLSLAVGAAVIATNRLVRPLLPLRYPIYEQEVDPRTKKVGNGVLYVGGLKSTSTYDRFKQLWANDDDLRRHVLVMGTTGSGKSELLKSIFYNALCWTSGFFCADGKADNKLPTDTLNLARMLGRDDDVLFLNFLLGGKTPEQVRRSRVRRTNRFNPFSSADADTVIQMGANMLPKVEGEGKNWQEKALNLWRAMVVAVYYKRDKEGLEVDVGTLIDYLSLPNIEKLYLRGYEEVLEAGGDPANPKDWSYGYAGIKSYLDSGCPAYKVEKLLAKHGLGPNSTSASRIGARPQDGKAFEQQDMAYEQHAYRTSQLLPVLNLLHKTYGHIFSEKYSEINMVDVTLNHRILAMLIPSLEKSAQEAENLGKLGIACLRVMMGRNLGADIEGSRTALLDSKATRSPVPYIVALDELGYYFADGIAVMFAQARSLGFCMIAAAQDLEKLMDGQAKSSETGAMLANQAMKYFLRIKDHGKTMDMIDKIVGKTTVAVRRTFEDGVLGFKKSRELEVKEVSRVSFQEMQNLPAGEGIVALDDRPHRFKSMYMGDDLDKHFALKEFWVNRFLQVAPPSHADLMAYSLPKSVLDDPAVKGEVLRQVLTYERRAQLTTVMPDPVLSAVVKSVAGLSGRVSAEMRAVVMYEAAKQALEALKDGQLEGGGAAGIDSGDPIAPGKGEDRAAAARVGADVPRSGVITNDDVLSFLDDEPFERKPAADLLDPDDDEVAETAVLSQDAVVDVVEMMQENLRSFNVETAEGMLDNKRGHRMNWVRDAVESVGKPRDEMEANVPTKNLADKPETAVGFTKQTLESVSDLEALLGNPAPKKAAKAVESAVSAAVTPDIKAGALDPSQIHEFFDILTKK